MGVGGGGGEVGGRAEVGVGAGGGSGLVAGSGHTISWQSRGQNSCIFSNGYNFRSSERPGGWMTGGRSSGEGARLRWSLENSLN